MHRSSYIILANTRHFHPSPVEPPNSLKYYIHRTGRTGHKDQPGLAILVYSGGKNAYGMQAGDLLRQVCVVYNVTLIHQTGSFTAGVICSLVSMYILLFQLS